MANFKLASLHFPIALDEREVVVENFQQFHLTINHLTSAFMEAAAAAAAKEELSWQKKKKNWLNQSVAQIDNSIQLGAI